MENNKTPSIRFKGFTDPWEQRKVLDLLELLTDYDANGSFADMAKNINTTDGDGYAWYVRITDLENPKPLSELKYVDESSYEFLKKTELHGGELLMAKRGNIGKVYIFEPRTKYATVAPNMYLLKLNNKVIPHFLYDYFVSEEGNKKLTRLNASSTMGALYKDDVKNIDVIMPSIEEQAMIGNFFQSIDHIITLHQRKYNKLLNVKKSMLEKMFPKNGSNIPEIRFKGFTDPWEQRKVSEVSEIVAGGTPSTSVSEYWEPKEVPWLSSGEVHKKYITYTDDMISKNGLANSSAKIIKKNSVLIALAGQGKTRGTVAINRISLSTNQSIAAMSFNDDIVPEFVFSNLENRYDEIRAMSSGDGSRGGLNKQLVGDITIPYTIKEEQQKIGQYFSNLDHLITLHQRELEKLQNIKKSMLEKMFV